MTAKTILFATIVFSLASVALSIDDSKLEYRWIVVDGPYACPSQEDLSSDMSQIHLGGITKDLWTRTRFLSKRRVHNPYGVIETPEAAGLVSKQATGY
jgi:hypothetical protein